MKLGLLILALALMIPSTAAAKSNRIYLYNVRQGWLVTPRTLDFCSSGCEYDSLSWRGWNTSVATGLGDFAPVVSGEEIGRYPVRIVLSKPKRCPNGRRIYSRYREVLNGDRPPRYPRATTVNMSCKGFGVSS